MTSKLQIIESYELDSTEAQSISWKTSAGLFKTPSRWLLSNYFSFYFNLKFTNEFIHEVFQYFTLIQHFKLKTFFSPLNHLFHVEMQEWRVGHRAPFFPLFFKNIFLLRKTCSSGEILITLRGKSFDLAAFQLGLLKRLEITSFSTRIPLAGLWFVRMSIELMSSCSRSWLWTFVVGEGNLFCGMLFGES